jgi:hypothetical protein
MPTIQLKTGLLAVPFSTLQISIVVLISSRFELEIDFL